MVYNKDKVIYTNREPSVGAYYDPTGDPIFLWEAFNWAKDRASISLFWDNKNLVNNISIYTPDYIEIDGYRYCRGHLEYGDNFYGLYGIYRLELGKR